MTVVFPPCIIDFAKAYLDQTPGFSEEALMDWETDVHELFGTDFERVMRLVSILRSYGIYYFDAKPGNIRF